MLKYKIDFETAKEEFEKFCDSWEIDTEEKSMSADEKIDFGSLKDKIIKAIRFGRLVYNGNGTATYTISGDLSGDLVGRELLIKRPRGDAWTGTDQFKEQAGATKTFSIIASMVNFPIESLNKLDGLDLMPLNAIATLFLAG